MSHRTVPVLADTSAVITPNAGMRVWFPLAWTADARLRAESPAGPTPRNRKEGQRIGPLLAGRCRFSSSHVSTLRIASERKYDPSRQSDDFVLPSETTNFSNRASEMPSRGKPMETPDSIRVPTLEPPAVGTFQDHLCKGTKQHVFEQMATFIFPSAMGEGALEITSLLPTPPRIDGRPPVRQLGPLALPL